MPRIGIGRDVGLGLPYRGAAGSAAAFAPSALFASGEPGAAYDDTDISTMWKDTAGTDPVTADGDPIARQDDISGNGNNRTQATATKRPLWRASPPAIEWDGVDDTLVSPSIDFSGTDKMSVFLGFRGTSNSSNQRIVEMSDTANSGNVFSQSVGGGIFQTLAHGPLAAEYNLTEVPYSSPESMYVTSLIDRALAGGDVDLTKNGSVSGTTTRDDDVSGNLDNEPIYFGTRGGSTLPFVGFTYGSITRGALSSDSEVADAEAWISERVP